MAGGPNNPLGARAMYLGSSLYRIHGSNEPWTKAIARALYFRYKDPQRLYAVTAKIERLNAELNQVYRIESEGPTFIVAATDPASIAKQITGPLTVDLRAEYASGGDGRIYTATVQCTDGNGLSAEGTAVVTVVKKDKKDKKDGND